MLERVDDHIRRRYVAEIVALHRELGKRLVSYFFQSFKHLSDRFYLLMIRLTVRRLEPYRYDDLYGFLARFFGFDDF